MPGPEAAGPADSPGAGDQESLPPHYRRNFIALTGDASAYFLAIAFLDPVTVLPLFFQRVYESLEAAHSPYLWLVRPAFLSGFAIAVRSAGWLVPQFFSAHAVSSRTRRKPILLMACWIGRLPLLLDVVYLCSPLGKSHPGQGLVLVLVTWCILSFGEGFAGVPWLFIISHAIPPRRRGRLFGGMQIIGGVLACAAGILVNRLLSPGAPPFPQNFGILFGLMFFFLMTSQVFLLMIHEPETGEDPPQSQSLRQYLRQLPELARLQPFRRMIEVQWLGSAAGMAGPLYTLFAARQFHAPAAAAGWYLSATMAGTVAGSLLWGVLNDRYNSRLVIRLNLVASLLGPWTALAVTKMNGAEALSPAGAAVVYCLSFFLGGVSFSGGWTGYTNYLLEMAPAAKRAEYVGLMNTLNTPVVLMPVLGTWLAVPFSTPGVFLAAGLGCLAALVLSRRLPLDPAPMAPDVIVGPGSD